MRARAVVSAAVLAVLFIPATPASANSGEIRDVTFSRPMMVLTPTGHSAVRIRFVVDLYGPPLPGFSLADTEIFVMLRRPLTQNPPTYTHLLLQGHCGVSATCELIGSSINFSVPLVLESGSVRAVLGHPGAYSPAISVTGSQPETPLAEVHHVLPTFPLKRATRIVHFNTSPEPVRKDSPVTVKGQLQRALPCPESGTVLRQSCEAGHPGFWHRYAGRAVDVYFDPVGDIGPRYRGTATTTTTGTFSRRFTARRPGTWSARFAGNSAHGPSISRRDYVALR
jgi:hypothetical protein